MHERIQKLRKALGLTQQEFSDKLNISRANIAGYETGRREPSDAAISLIAENSMWKKHGSAKGQAICSLIFPATMNFPYFLPI